jgi:serine/threonine protein kinase
VLALEFMPRGSIDGCIADMTIHQKVMAILSTVLGLAFLHSQGVVYGRVTPSNLLLDAEFHAKLSDFSLADPMDPTPGAGRGERSFHYFSNEVLEGEEPTVRSDVYSLGLLIFFVITGRHVFDPRMSIMRQVRMIVRGVTIELPNAKPELVQLMQRMVALNPEDRPASMEEVFEVMRKHDFAFFPEVDAGAIRGELAKYGVWS